MSHVSYAEPPAQGWDIHCHTVFSDGTETPRTLVEQARKLGLHGVAIADHDTTAGWDEATEASEEIGLPLLLGTEITAVDEDVSVHMLAFQYDPSNEHISSMFANTRAARLRRTKRMVERLSQDFPITWDDVLAQVKEGERTTIGRPHIADALVAAGVYETRSDAFADAVSAKSKYYIPTPSPSTHEVIAAVKGASSEYQMMIDHLNGKDIATLFVEVEPDANKYNMEETIATEFRNRIGFTPQAKPVDIEDLPRSEKKTTRIFDNRY